MKTKTRNMAIYGLILAFLLTIVSPGLAAPSNQESANQTTLTSLFKDVTDQDANLAFINYLYNRGIIKGFPDGTYHPNEGLTRAQAASIMVLAGKLKVDPSQASPFADVSAGHWARANIAAAVQTGYISGFPDKSFRPEDNLSRAQAVSMLLRLSKQSTSSAVLPHLSDMNSNHWAAPAVAVGIASGMLSLSTDQQQVNPEQAISRGDLSRALGVLLTQDPDLSSMALVGKIQVKSGTVTIQSSNQAVRTVTGSSEIVAGDTISTAKSSEADITYNDGSGLLLKGDSQLIIKEARGRSYIKADGSVGIAIDWLLLDLKQGQMFGALATSSSPQTSPTSTEKKATSYLGKKQLLASLNSRNFMAAAPASGKDMPWYEASKTKKVKVEVDMPWGVAAIRGTFWNNLVNTNGSGSTSILTGSGEVTAGGQTVSLAAGQATQVTGSGTPPTPPQAMTPTQMGVWSQVAAWAQQRAEAIQQSQGAPPPSSQPVNTSPINIVQAVSQAISSAQSAANNTNTTNDTNGNNNNNNNNNTTNILGSYTLSDQVTVADYVYDNGVLTQDFSISPAAATAQATYYELWAKLGENNYVQIAKPTPIAKSIRHLKKAFNQPDKLRVTFLNSSYEPLASSALSNGKLTDLATQVISGTIFLPTGITAPAGGMKIIVYAKGPEYFGNYGQFRQEISIAAGSSAANYSLSVPAHDGYKLGYDIIGTYVEKLIMSGNLENPVNVSNANQSNQDMYIKEGKVIAGTISLPQSVTASNELKVKITAGLTINNVSTKFFPSTTATIPAGQNWADYSLVVPTNANCKIFYDLYFDKGSNSDINEFLVNNLLVRQAYYNSSGSTNKYSLATEITAGTADVANINLNVLIGNKISGIVTIANCQQAPPGGCYINIWAYEQSGGTCYITTNVKMQPGSYSVPYTLVVAPGIYKLFWTGSSNSTSSVDANSENAIANLETNLYPNSSLSPIPLTDVAPRSVLVGNTIFGIDSPMFAEDNVLKALYSNGSALYYQSAAEKWFDLQKPEATSGNYINDANAIADPCTALPPIYYTNQLIQASAKLNSTYYLAAGYITNPVRAFTMLPKDTVLVVSSPNPELANLVFEDLGDGNWTGKIITCTSAPATNTLTVTASRAGYTDITKEVTINVLPTITCNPDYLWPGYNNKSIDLISMEGTWAAGDTLDIQLIDASTGSPVNGFSGSGTGSVVNGSSAVSFAMPDGLALGEYYFYVIKNGIPVAAGKFEIILT